jgi:hypothetical protein
VLEVDTSTLSQEKFAMDPHTQNWKNLPLWLKLCFSFNFLNVRPARSVARRIELLSHVSGFLFCLLGLVNRAALEGGLIMLANAYLFSLLTWQGDKFGIWYDVPDTGTP